MPALICGSLAFDTITLFEGRFADQILPEQIHILNVSFLVPTLRREFGGCAGNIAYGLKQLGGEPLPMAAAGPDGKDYLQRFDNLGISTEFIQVVADSYTAQAIIMTDRDNNQITAFHPGAMQQAHRCVIHADPRIKLAIVAPDGRDAMIQHADQLARLGIPFVFDPGQGLPMFNGDELSTFLSQATWLTLNDYEARMLCDKTGLEMTQIAAKLRGAIVTLGADGCDVYEGHSVHRVQPVKASAIVDPTGCGDAFRSALLFGLERGWSLLECARLGNQVGSRKIASRGGQNYSLDLAELLT
jgi:adenosine kinase